MDYFMIFENRHQHTDSFFMPNLSSNNREHSRNDIYFFLILFIQHASNRFENNIREHFMTSFIIVNFIVKEQTISVFIFFVERINVCKSIFNFICKFFARFLATAVRFRFWK